MLWAPPFDLFLESVVIFDYKWRENVKRGANNIEKRGVRAMIYLYLRHMEPKDCSQAKTSILDVTL